MPVQVAPKTTVEAAISASGMMAKFPDIELGKSQVGIFGKLTKLETTLNHLDRIEIYRPLIADPKEVRRQRAADGKAMKKGGGDAPP
jgi:putative ubiquitin-RnfH superfamily antitoxin RatB of RatAB toxin-antitoxin module